jgi:hypothetical protein
LVRQDVPGQVLRDLVRRPAHEVQTPRRLHEKATARSCSHSVQRN